jgi:anthranilate phosphoribosyltransferase
VRILGKGKRGARGLTREEARAAMTLLLEGKVEDTQLGAFLMLLRHKEESAEELAGFTEALRAHLQAPHQRRSGLAELRRQEAPPALVPAGGQVPGR